MELKNIAKKNFINIDIVRIVLAVLVMSIHSIVVSDRISFYAVQGLARWAVPLFFMFIGMNLSVDKFRQKSAVTKYVKTQCNIFLPWICLITVIALFDIVSSNSLKYAPFLYTQFWFVLASCFSLLYIFLLLRFLDFKMLFVISCILHLFGILGDGYFGIMSDIPYLGEFYKGFLSVFMTTRWGFSFGLFYICLGMIFSENSLEKVKPVIKLFAFIALCFLQALEITLLKQSGARDYNMYFSLIPISILIFDFILSHSHSRPSLISYKRLSVYIYITHTIIVFCISNKLDVFGIRSVFFETVAVYLILAAILIPCKIVYTRYLKGSFFEGACLKIKKLLPPIILASGIVCLTACVCFMYRPGEATSYVALIAITLISIGVTARCKTKEVFKRSMLFIACIIIGVSSILLNDFVLLKHFKICPIYTIDAVDTGKATYYSTLFYEAYVADETDLPVQFESKKEFNYEYTDSYFSR